ncbi:MAG: 6-pyruvoyl tetrahydropterin synthase family protein [Promethearchaeota archaeon]|nr:MAG: 6-pyruvoyl tetrahydropterin synthase family protein [Candidatus Lokiarchaeota archaeon]
MGFKVVVKDSEIKFSACHFLKEPLKCSRIHGHNYYVSVEIESNLDENHFVVDFIELKQIVKSIVKPLDHFVLVPKYSKDLKITEKNESVKVVTESNKKYMFPKCDVKFLPLEATTSEILAKYIHSKLKELLPNKLITVRIEESKSTTAVFSDDGP